MYSTNNNIKPKKTKKSKKSLKSIFSVTMFAHVWAETITTATTTTGTITPAKATAPDTNDPLHAHRRDTTLVITTGPTSHHLKGNLLKIKTHIRATKTSLDGILRPLKRKRLSQSKTQQLNPKALEKLRSQTR